jgi:histidine triad (HIT) family protein
MSLDLTYDTGNIFAKIITGDIPSAKVHEDDRTLSFMDAFPQTKGHTLVIPKVNACNLFDIAPRDLRDLVGGEAAGQTVFHIHFHILPVWNDQAERGHASGKMADINDLRALAEQIRAKL